MGNPTSPDPASAARSECSEQLRAGTPVLAPCSWAAKNAGVAQDCSTALRQQSTTQEQCKSVHWIVNLYITLNDDTPTTIENPSSTSSRGSAPHRTGTLTHIGPRLGSISSWDPVNLGTARA